MLTPPELVWLLAAVAKGDEVAFSRLYAATRAKLYGIVLRILRRKDLADEVMQETYLKIWHGAGQFDPLRASPVTWMVAVARNGAIDLLRRRGDILVEGEPDVLTEATDTPDSLAANEFSEELQRLLACIGRLPPEQQRLVLRAYYDGSSREQLATELEASVDTIRTWLRRSLIEIREGLDG